MDAAIEFARSAVNLKFKDIPKEVVSITKKIIFDALAVGAAGSTAPGARDVVELVREWGGTKESTVIASNCRVPTLNAAFANGAMMRAVDYNETYNLGRTHPSISVIPAAFAIAEKKGNINGKQFITAVAFAMDMHNRLSAAPARPGDWMMPQLNGYFSAAAAAGLLLGLDEDEMVNAFGLSYQQAGGARQFTLERAVSRGLQGAFASKSGVMAALMAEKGITGSRNSLEGEHGLFPVYHHSEYDRNLLTSGLGKNFDTVLDTSFKAYPSCRVAHSSVDAALKAVHDYNIRPEDVDSILILTGAFSQKLCEPLDVCRNPNNIAQAQYSIPYNIALAVVKGNVTLDDFMGPGYRDPEVLKIAAKVTSKFTPELVSKDAEAAIIEITTKNKKVCKARADFSKGDPEVPLTREEHIAKFKDCARLAAYKISDARTNKLIDMVDNLEKVTDAGQVIKLVAGSPERKQKAKK